MNARSIFDGIVVALVVFLMGLTAYSRWENDSRTAYLSAAGVMVLIGLSWIIKTSFPDDD